MQPKSFLASKTIWANVLAFGAAIGTAFGLDLGLTPEVQAELVAGVIAVVNIFLRFGTQRPVKL